MRERCYCPQLPNKIVFFYSISSVINLVWLSTRHAATRDPWIYGNSWITYNLTVGCITAPIVAHDCSRATSLDEAILSVLVADHTFGGAMRQNEINPQPPPPFRPPFTVAPWGNGLNRLEDDAALLCFEMQSNICEHRRCLRHWLWDRLLLRPPRNVPEAAKQVHGVILPYKQYSDYY